MFIRIFLVALMTMFVAITTARAECGIASWYNEGSRTATGERYNPMGISAAHKTLPFGTKVRVRNTRTGRDIVVRINDRGPFIAGRIIDLSQGAKLALGMGGLAHVCIDIAAPATTVKAFDRKIKVRRPRVRAEVGVNLPIIGEIFGGFGHR